MEIIRGHYNIRAHHSGCVATIGNFDGVHLGHRAVLRELVDRARSLGLTSTVITFEPQPQEYFAGHAAPPRLTRFSEKMHELERLAVERVCVLRFNGALAEMSADAFIADILIGGLGVRHLVVGDDFRFGKGRSGGFELLASAGARYGFEVAATPSVEVGGIRVSSTAIRSALAEGDMDLARRLLGRAYRIRGRIAHGDRRGRSLGFPTANLCLHRKVAPVSGVYAVRMLGLGAEAVPGVANVGRRPTVRGDGHVLLEVHLFDFSADIYGRKVEVELVAKLREERRFSSLQELSLQIGADARQAREILLGDAGYQRTGGV